MPLTDILQWILRIALAALFIGMGAAHFVPKPARGMAAMIPAAFTRWLSAKTLVRFTGLCEIAGGIGLLLPATRLAAGIALIVFLVAVFPANAYAAKHPERFGSAAVPFWPRLLGQLGLMALIVLAII